MVLELEGLATPGALKLAEVRTVSVISHVSLELRKVGELL